ncbi:hypothetical protein [Parasynechococcus sp.]|uniref:hypothetical protein n=1 Tax=Parasynechococcus sp. TaxID=3101203 RepID=UPI00388E79BE
MSSDSSADFSPKIKTPLAFTPREQSLNLDTSPGNPIKQQVLQSMLLFVAVCEGGLF